MIDLSFPTILSAVGVIIGVTGTILNISTKLKLKLVVFIFWAISDLVLVFWAIYSTQVWLGTMYTIYLFIAMMGLTNTLRVLRKPQYINTRR
jgi:hypothetical protein